MAKESKSKRISVSIDIFIINNLLNFGLIID